MTRLLPLYVSLAALALVGCKENSTELPEDGRDITADNYPASDNYSGRVMNGYLKGARVWLDMDGDGLYTSGPVEVELPSGSVAIVEGGEPTALSGEDGRFTLDITGLQQDVTVAPDLNPQNYRLHALVIPGSTLEETRDGDVSLERTYILSSLEGTRNVSPLTTLQAKMRDYGSNDGLGSRLAGLNLQNDYIQSDSDRGRAYSSMLTRFMREQLPQEYTDALRGEDGLNFVIPDDALELLGIALVQNANELLLVVDEAADGNYGNVAVQELDMPVVDLELNDPQLLVGQRVEVSYGSGSSLDEAAEIVFNYGSDARVTSIEADGCMQPSVFEIARLANADGKIDDTTNQWFPSVSLSASSPGYLDEEAYPGVDERLTFDWANNTATFDTRTDCHGGTAVAELDGSAEITYTWTLEEERVISLTAENSVTGVTQTFIPQYDNEGPVFFGYELQEAEATVETLSLTEEFFLDGDVVECPAGSEPVGDENYDPEAANLVTATQQYRYEVDGVAEGEDYLLYDTRQARHRLIRFGLPAASLVWGVDFENGFNWTMEYVDGAEDEKRAGLISNAALNNFAATANTYGDSLPGCWQAYSADSGKAKVSYSYQSLSAYLTSQDD